MIEQPRNVLTVWARLVAASLVSAGVRDVVVSPGSRSTPFVLALRERPELRLSSVLDERVAAFVALGMGRATGVPAAALATSGTAPAHWLPATIEASVAKVPLLLLSANRPIELAHSGAAQTIDQTKLFGGWVRLFTDLGNPSADESALIGVSRGIAQAVATTMGPDAGPVHLDLHADKPLEPIEPRTDAELELVTRADAIARRGTMRVTWPAPGPDERFAQALADALDASRRPLIVAGPRVGGDEARVLAACAQLGIVLAAEWTSQLRTGMRTCTCLDASEVVFASARARGDLAPDLVVQLGTLPTAPTLERAFGGVRRFVLEAGGAHDPIGGAEHVSLAPAGATLARTAAIASSPRRDEAWIGSLREAERTAWSEVERAIAGGRGEGAVVRAALASSAGATLVIGNSLPIRTLDRFVPGGPAGRRVLCQRGANGIDGLVSGAIGSALATGEPLLAIVGDVSFVHDSNALVAARAVRTPLVVVVVDNGGGRIFETLPVARVAADAMPLFTTPHDVDLTALARAFGVTCIETDDAAGTSRAVSSAIREPRLTIVRAVVDPHDAHASFDALVRAFDARFQGGAP